MRRWSLAGWAVVVMLLLAAPGGVAVVYWRTIQGDPKDSTTLAPMLLPTGGTTGQVLTKSGNGDYAVQWAAGGGGGGGVSSVSVGQGLFGGGVGDVTVGLSVASATSLGGVRVGAGLTVASDGTLSATGGGGGGTPKALTVPILGDDDAGAVLWYELEFSTSDTFASVQAFTSSDNGLWLYHAPGDDVPSLFPEEGVEAWWSWEYDVNYNALVRVAHGAAGGTIVFKIESAGLLDGTAYWRMRATDGTDYGNWIFGAL